MILEFTYQDGMKSCINMKYVHMVEYSGGIDIDVLWESDQPFILSFEDAAKASLAYHLIRRKWLEDGFVISTWDGKLNSYNLEKR